MSSIGRPHHHACLFGIDFADKVIWQRKKTYNIYISDELSRLWSTRVKGNNKNRKDKDVWKANDGKYYRRKGFVTITDCNFNSARYLARYVTKKITGSRAAEHYRVVDRETGEIQNVMPEYVTVSNRPGLGEMWYREYGHSDCHLHDQIHINARVYRAPKYYDKLLEKSNPRLARQVKLKRKQKALDNAQEMSLVRSRERQKIAERKLLRTGERSYENGL